MTLMETNAFVQEYFQNREKFCFLQKNLAHISEIIFCSILAVPENDNALLMYNKLF